VHLGHSTTLWHPATLPFIYGTRAGISIINLEYTLSHLRRACAVTKEISYNGGVIVFIGTRPAMQRAVYASSRLGGDNVYWVTRRWIAGTITNAQHVLGHVAKSNVWDVPEQDLAVMGLKKHQAKRSRVPRPDLLVVANPLENQIALAEANTFKIPTVGLVDTDCDPACVTYPIVANDDSVRGVELIMSSIAQAAREGRHEYLHK
jgi:small subunit ribosomal protein S2